jgi:hypothetical protein
VPQWNPGKLEYPRVREKGSLLGFHRTKRRGRAALEHPLPAAYNRGYNDALRVFPAR